MESASPLSIALSFFPDQFLFARIDGNYGGLGSAASYYKCVYFLESTAMFKIVIDPIVLQRLRKAFPKPPQCADKALEKYRLLLEDLLFKAIQRGRSAYELRFNLYSIPAADLSHKGPQLSLGKERLHAWLKAQQLDLIQIVELGSNLNGLVSKVRLTNLVTIDDGLTGLAQQLSYAKSAAEVDALLCADMAANAKLLSELFPDYFSYLSAHQRAQVFDNVPIDIGSLEAYIVWLNTKATKLSATKIQTYTRQAMMILAVAKYTGGYFPMRKKPSDFGRMYYTGTSVQNVDKTLRRAMLGDCWEYDIKSAVIAWKLTFAQELAAALDPNRAVERQFWASILYVTVRSEFMRDVRAATFDQSTLLPRDAQNALIKQAVTAIGFGARAKTSGWREVNGTWTNPSLVELLKNPDERSRFFACPMIQQFITEQAALDKYLAHGMKAAMPEVYFGPLITANTKPSPSKAVAYLYQHQETQAMNIARAVLAKHGIQPIANIHDAFIVKRKLPTDVLHEVIFEMQEQMENPYFSMKGDKLEGFRFAI